MQQAAEVHPGNVGSHVPRFGCPMARLCHLAMLAATLVLATTACLPMVIQYPDYNGRRSESPRFDHIESVTFIDSVPFTPFKQPSIHSQKSDEGWRYYKESWAAVAASFPNSVVILPRYLGQVFPGSGHTARAPSIEEVHPIVVTIRSRDQSDNPVGVSCILTFFTFGLIPCYGSRTDHIEYEVQFPHAVQGRTNYIFEYELTERQFGGWAFGILFWSLDEPGIPNYQPESETRIRKRMIAMGALSRRFLLEAAPILTRFETNPVQ